MSCNVAVQRRPRGEMKLTRAGSPDNGYPVLQNRHSSSKGRVTLRCDMGDIQIVHI